MLVLTRYRVAAADSAGFLADARAAVAVLSAQPGCVAVRIGRAVDDPQLWIMQSEWESVGRYRRALSAYEVKLHAVPLMSRCIDEPSAFEVRLDGVQGRVAEIAGALADGDAPDRQ